MTAQMAWSGQMAQGPEMPEYTLYYWSVPFRGQFVRAVLAYAGKTWTEGGDAAIANLMAGPAAKMPVPFMGPPLRAMTIKIVNDANDVLDEMTLDGGRQMWTKQRWERLCCGCRNGCRSGRRRAGATA